MASLASKNVGDKVQAVKHKKSNKGSKKGSGELKIHGNGNGDNLVRIFEKVYKTDAKQTLSKSIESMKATGDLKEIGKPGQYGYTVAVKTKDGSWSTDPEVVKNKLAGHAPTENPIDSLKAVALKQVSPGGLESTMSNRFGRAFHEGDASQGNSSFMSAFERYKKDNPGKIRLVGQAGEPGTYVQVKVGQDWVSDSTVVAKNLAKYASVKDQSKNKATSQLTKQQKDLLMGANGQAVLNSFANKYGSSEVAQSNLHQAIKAYEQSSPGNDIRVFGKIGQPGFYIEVKTKDGWVNSTNRVLGKLDKFMPTLSSTTAPQSPAGSNTESAFAPGATGPNQSGGSVPSAGDLATDNDPSASLPSGALPSDGQTELESGLQIGVEAGSAEEQQYSDNLNNFLDARQAEQDSFKQNKPAKVREVSVGEAARKSEAIMAFDLDGNGKISKAERALAANGDQNNNGIVGEKGLKNFVAQADTNNSGLVSQAEVKAYNVLDTNNDNKLGAKEMKAYKRVDANGDGDITKKEAKAMVKDLRAQVDLSKQEKKDLDLAKEYLAKSGNKGGGAQGVDEQVAALVNAQPKHDKPKDNDGPGKKKKNKNN
ncbi:hypothetical protein H6794_03900 [Candidatus Nomurabacteria bacterium]|nr:hypothetical protein [Candidatus Saccharibacteria bacterium]MCB9839973.1 hypothetical protein [Candidatus Nomurabacteria bacterium]